MFPVAPAISMVCLFVILLSTSVDLLVRLNAQERAGVRARPSLILWFSSKYSMALSLIFSIVAGSTAS
jgi:hypothetical protein